MRLFVPLETKDAGIEEERLLCPGEIEWKLAQPAADADAGHELDCKVSGYGAVFNNEDLGGDIILPGAFKRSLSEWTKRKSMPAMLWQHMSDQVIGAWDDIAEDDRGENALWTNPFPMTRAVFRAPFPIMSATAWAIRSG